MEHENTIEDYTRKPFPVQAVRYDGNNSDRLAALIDLPDLKMHSTHVHAGVDGMREAVRLYSGTRDFAITVPVGHWLLFGPYRAVWAMTDKDFRAEYQSAEK